MERLFSFFLLVLVLISTFDVISALSLSTLASKGHTRRRDSKYQVSTTRITFSKLLNTANSNGVGVNDDIFGAEFKDKRAVEDEESRVKEQAMKGFDKVRATFLKDGIFVGAMGLSLSLAIGTMNDALSYAVGAVLGLGYSLLLGNYVERIGSTESQSSGEGNSRFLPAIVLIALYGKFRGTITIIPELIGFFSTYKIATLLQIFNRNLYGDEGISLDAIEEERRRL